eukprot:gene2373-2935_t
MTTAICTELIERQKKILERIEILSKKLDELTCTTNKSEIQQRVENLCDSISLKNHLVRVPKNYYNWTLENRKTYLGAPSIHNLCKSIIVENTDCTTNDTSNPNNSRFYCLIIQYTTRFQTQPEDSYRLSGFEYNAVCPIGTSVPIPIIISKRLFELDYPVVWLGGGEVDLKFAVDIRSFKEAIEKSIPSTKVFVADIVIDEINNNNDIDI